MNLFVCFILEFSICFVILEFWVWVPKSMLKKLHCQCNHMCRSFYFPGSMYTYANCMHIYIYTNTDMCILVKINVRIYLCIPITYTHIYYIHVWFSHFMLYYLFFIYTIFYYSTCTSWRKKRKHYEQMIEKSIAHTTNDGHILPPPKKNKS